MKDYNSDSTVVLDRFARDKRKRTTTAERIERRPGPRRDADDTPREHAPRRASYNPHFTEDNRPVDERPRRPSGGSRYGEGRPSGPYRGRPDGPRSDRSGGYGGERSAAGISVTANVRVRRNVTVRSPRADSSATIAAARCGPRAIPAIIPTCRRAKSA